MLISASKLASELKTRAHSVPHAPPSEMAYQRRRVPKAPRGYGPVAINPFAQCERLLDLKRNPSIRFGPQ